MQQGQGAFDQWWPFSQESEQGVEQYCNELQNVNQQYQYAPVHDVYQKPNKCKVNKVECPVSRRSDS
nr:hypothetical protein [Tanacetum cinerariifolium]